MTTPTTTDSQQAARLAELYREAQNGLRRVVALGLFCYEIKARLKHGQFGDWVKKHAPEDVSYRGLRAFMLLTTTALEAAGVQIGSVLPICRNGDLMLLPEADLEPEAVEVRAKICKVIDGKSQRQLFLEFKAAREDSEGNLSVLPQHGGGDRVWEKWLHDQHPELIDGGEIPPRAKVKLAIRREFDAWRAKKMGVKPRPQAEVADEHLAILVAKIEEYLALGTLITSTQMARVRALETIDVLRDRINTLNKTDRKK